MAKKTTFPLHIAASVGTSVIGIFTSTVHSAYHHEGSRIKCLKKAKNWVIYLIKGCSLKT